MPTNVFVSYDHNDQSQVNGFKALKFNPNHPLDFHDHSLNEPATDRSGKFDRASKLVVLIGNNTHQSAWVDWEICSAVGCTIIFRHAAKRSRRNVERTILGSRPRHKSNTSMPTYNC
jgi:MTH538 TIR-like domain (DUF1863)